MLWLKSWCRILLCIGCAFLFSCNQEISVTKPETPAPRRTLFISSKPSGALIFLNNRNMGQFTPDSLPWLQTDSISVLLRLEYYRDSVFTTKVQADNKTEINVDFTQNPMMLGGMYIDSFPDSADIYINDSVTGKRTPFTFTGMLPGEYSIRLKHFSCRDAVFKRTVYSNTTATASPGLEDTTYWVTYLPENSAIPEAYFNTIFIDRHGIKWLGGSSTGLTRFDGSNFKTFHKSNSGIPGNQVLSIEEDASGYLWVGTENGLARFDGSTFLVYNTSNSALPSNNITSLRIGTADTLYIGTNKGLVCKTGETFTIFPDSPVLDAWVTGLGITIYNSLVVSTTKGLFVQFGSQWESFDVFNFSYVSSILLLTNGRAWVGNLGSGKSGGGLYYLRANISNPNVVSIMKVVLVSNFAADNIYSILQTTAGVIWVATDNGVGSFVEVSATKRYTVAGGHLKSNKARKLFREANGTLWIATMGGGITKYKGGT